METFDTIDMLHTETEVKKGFKKTKIGWIPEDWKIGRVSDLLYGLESGVSVNGQERELINGEKGVLKVSAVSYGHFNPKAVKVIESAIELKRAKTNPKKDQIIISRSNTEELVGASVYIDKDYENLFLPDKLWQTIPNSKTNMKWLSFILSSEYSRYTLSNLATGTSGSMKNITKNELLNLKIPLPPLPEQRKIAEILSTWDQAINHTQNLISRLKLRKKGLTQQLLTGKTRLKGFYDEWKEFSYNSLLKEVRRPVKWDDEELYHLVSVRRRSGGLFERDKLLGKEILTKNLKTTKTGDFLISKMQIVHGASGLTTEKFDNMKISGSYISLRSRKENILTIEFFSWLSQLPFFYYQTYIASFGVHIEKMTFEFKYFLKLKVLIPAVQEQIKIVKILTTADNEIKAYDNYLAQLQAQKKGLMQQLLTGQKRVKC